MKNPIQITGLDLLPTHATSGGILINCLITLIMLIKPHPKVNWFEWVIGSGMHFCVPLISKST